MFSCWYLNWIFLYLIRKDTKNNKSSWEFSAGLKFRVQSRDEHLRSSFWLRKTQIIKVNAIEWHFLSGKLQTVWIHFYGLCQFGMCTSSIYAVQTQRCNANLTMSKLFNALNCNYISFAREKNFIRQKQNIASLSLSLLKYFMHDKFSSIYFQFIVFSLPAIWIYLYLSTFHSTFDAYETLKST